MNAVAIAKPLSFMQRRELALPMNRSCAPRAESDCEASDHGNDGVLPVSPQSVSEQRPDFCRKTAQNAQEGGFSRSLLL